MDESKKEPDQFLTLPVKSSQFYLNFKFKRKCFIYVGCLFKEKKFFKVSQKKNSLQNAIEVKGKCQEQKMVLVQLLCENYNWELGNEEFRSQLQKTLNQKNQEKKIYIQIYIKQLIIFSLISNGSYAIKNYCEKVSFC